MDNPDGLPTRPPPGRRLPTSSTEPNYDIVNETSNSTPIDEEPPQVAWDDKIYRQTHPQDRWEIQVFGM